MSKQIYINLPVKDLTKATEFYTALGFIKNEQWSSEDASAMAFSDDILVMLLTHQFYGGFTIKIIPDLDLTSSVLIALSMDTREEVDAFAKKAKELGGSYFEAEPNKGLDFMYGLEVTDLDGHTLEPFYMDLSKLPSQTN